MGECAFIGKLLEIIAFIFAVICAFDGAGDLASDLSDSIYFQVFSGLIVAFLVAVKWDWRK